MVKAVKKPQNDVNKMCLLFIGKVPVEKCFFQKRHYQAPLPITSF